MEIHMVTFNMRVELIGRRPRAWRCSSSFIVLVALSSSGVCLVLVPLSSSGVCQSFRRTLGLFKECHCLGKTQWVLYPQFIIAESKDNRASNRERISLDDAQYSTLAKKAGHESLSHDSPTGKLNDSTQEES